MKTNNPLPQSCVIPAKAGIQQEQTPREADKIAESPGIRWNFIVNWIPAYAGMTG